ncbi:MAG TPA: nitroreductase family protein [Spirochaetia bacterium]|nr:nitroreductase family protein [Spirochaetia bacterium]
MIDNPVLSVLRGRASVRKYRKEQPSEEVIEAVLSAGRQAPFASQLYSVLLTRKKKAPFGAPLWFVVCVDAHKLERFMALRGWKVATNDLTLLLLGMQDAAYAAENMVIAAESLGMGSCFLGEGSINAKRIGAIAKQYNLPKRVLPMVELVMGYPEERLAPRPRYPRPFVLFEDRYPELGEAEVRDAMRAMDEGYLAEGYYAKLGNKIELEDGREDRFTFADYSWTEHISRKWGQWEPFTDELLAAFRERGFDLGPNAPKA